MARQAGRANGHVSTWADIGRWRDHRQLRTDATLGCSASRNDAIVLAEAYPGIAYRVALQEDARSA
jgi:hypothetical protein